MTWALGTVAPLGSLTSGVCVVRRPPPESHPLYRQSGACSVRGLLVFSDERCMSGLTGAALLTPVRVSPALSSLLSLHAALLLPCPLGTPETRIVNDRCLGIIAPLPPGLTIRLEHVPGARLRRPDEGCRTVPPCCGILVHVYNHAKFPVCI